MVWSHVMSQAPMMSNPYEYRELMRAQFRYGEERTVDQVLADHKRRHDDQQRAARDKSKGGRTFAPTQAAAGTEEIAPDAMASVKALLGMK